MAVGFKVDCFWYQIGSGDILHSVFSTITYHLEQNGWGSKYPIIMKELYSGVLKAPDVVKAIDEIKEIKNELCRYKPTEVIWDIEDLTKQPPWGYDISNQITSLANYFVTSDGRDLIELLEEALNNAYKYNCGVEIQSI